MSASTPLPLEAGQVLEVSVRAVGPLVELDLLDSPEAVSERAYELAAVIEARQAAGSTPGVLPGEVRALLDWVARAPVPPGQESARAQAAQRAEAALGRVSLGEDAGRLAQLLRQAVQTSGTFLEARLAAASRAGTPDVAALRNDGKAVLTELAALTRDAPALEETRARLVSDVLARQVEVAYHRVKDHELRLDVPVSIDGAPSNLQLRVRDDPPPPDDESPASGRQIALTLELPDLGRVKATIAWTPGHLATRFKVEAQTQAEALEGGLEALSARLRAVGFRQVALGVDVDPAAFVEPPDEPIPEMPGGSILRVRV